MKDDAEMLCNDTSGRASNGESSACSKYIHVENSSEMALIMQSFSTMKMCVSEVWRKCDNSPTKLKRRWMMYIQEN